MSRILFILAIMIPSLVLSQTNDWWEKTNLQTNTPLSIGLSPYSLVSATDSINQVKYVAGVSSQGFGDFFYEFDGNSWLLRGSYSGDIFDMCYYKGFVYVASNSFIYADSIYTFSSGYLSRYDGQLWEYVYPIDGFVRGLDVIDDTLYIGGQFDIAGTFESPRAAKFDGENWHPLPNNPFVDRPNYGYISCFAKYNGELYMGGLSPDVNDPEIFVYRDQEWQEVGNGIPGLNTKIDFLEVYQGELYAAGVIWQEQGNAANAIQKWDGEAWSQVGVGLNTTFLYGMKKFQDGLYVNGVFNHAGDTQLNGLARWDGTRWCGLRTYTEGQFVQGMFEFNDSLYVPLYQSDTDPFFSELTEIYKWIGGDDYDPCSISTSVAEKDQNKLSVYPNPTVGLVYLNSSALINDVEVYDITGKCVLRKNIQSKFVALNISNFAEGLYIAKIQFEKSIKTIKILKR